MYSFTKTGSLVAHIAHNWEEFHAYLADELPKSISRDSSGLCCHDCQLVVIDR